MALDNDQRAIQDQDQPRGWPELFGQLILDFTRVLEAEARLMRASIEPTLTSVLDHWLWQLVMATIALMGCVLLVAAVVLLLHAWLVWWLASAITGAAMILMALCGLLMR